MDAMIAREYQSGGETKTQWIKIGVAWPSKNGGYRVVFDSLPTAQINRDGRVETSVLLMPPRSDNGSGGRSGGSSRPSGASFDSRGDDGGIPF